MEGDYPKDFYFCGWHPHCFCYATPILVSEEEMEKVTDAFLDGKKYIPQGEDITDTPESFKKWINKNRTRIQSAKAVPYWMKDNPKYIDVNKNKSFESKDNDYSKPEIKKILNNSNIEMSAERELLDITSSKEIGLKLFKDSEVNAFEISSLTEGYSAFDRKRGVVNLSNITIGNSRPYNADFWFRSALATIKAKKELCFEEEYSIEIIQHEMTHAKAKGWKGPRSEATIEQIRTVEAATQLIARMSYQQMLSRLGVVNAKHTEEVISNGFGYNISTGNMLKIIDKLQVGRMKAISDIKRLLQDDYYETFERRLKNYLVRNGMKNAPNCIKHLNAFEEDFELYLRM